MLVRHYKKFEGSLGEFLEQYSLSDVQFYTMSNLGYHVKMFNSDIDELTRCYFRSGIYTFAHEEDVDDSLWKDHLPELCLVTEMNTGEKTVAFIQEYDGNFYFAEGRTKAYREATPITLEEAEKFILEKERKK